MAQQRYSKLQFDSMERLNPESSEEEEEEEPTTPTSQPQAKPQDDRVTSQMSNGSKSASKSKAKSEDRSEGSRSEEVKSEVRSEVRSEGKPDPTIVMTRDYYGLAQTVGGNHSCLILVTNRSTGHELKDPVAFTKRGYMRIPPDASIQPDTNAYCAFRKQSLTIKGTSGVLSYEYDRKDGRSKRFAVFWRVPYRLVSHEENEVALKWMDVDLDDPIDSNTHTTLELYKEMANCDCTVKGTHIAREVAKNGKCVRIVNVEDDVAVQATFSGNSKAIVKVDFSLAVPQ